MMSEKDLKKLKREDLLEIMVEQGKEINRLKAELDDTKAKLESRDLLIDEAGSIAEASLMVNGVFKAAEEAAKQYLENIEKLSARQEEVCAKREAECEANCALKEAECQERCTKREAECNAICAQKEAECEEAMQKVLTETSKYWKEVRGILKSE